MTVNEHGRCADNYTNRNISAKDGIFFNGMIDKDQINGNPEAKPSEKKSLAQVKAEFVKGVMDKMHGDDFDSEEERQAFENKIQQKIKNGAKLSAKEMAYIRRTILAKP